jgi:DnaJ-class molecular chaperone
VSYTFGDCGTCDGMGVVVEEDEYGVLESLCPICNGTGNKPTNEEQEHE